MSGTLFPQVLQRPYLWTNISGNLHKNLDIRHDSEAACVKVLSLRYQHFSNSIKASVYYTQSTRIEPNFPLLVHNRRGLPSEIGHNCVSNEMFALLGC